MTSGYAFTDYKSQGQTILYVYIDLEKPPSGKLTPFSAYVALSRSKGRDRIRLLRGFDMSLFTKHPSPDLEKEDERLDELTAETKKLYA
ncbi:hypothetical protein C8R47DRAFT_988306 [Mycena vitilis]|nr:hypothetical protein C8R47DRAFT_988306 [Mycena vitilis]